MSASTRSGTWAATRLSTIARVIRRRVKPQDHPELPFVGMDNVEAHTMRLLGTVPSSTMKSASVHFRPGDVLYGRLRPYLNKVYVPDFEGLASAEFIPLTTPGGVVPEFLQYRINAADFVAYASQLDEGDRPRVDYDQIAAFEVELPPSGEQRRIVEAIESYSTRLDDAVATLERVQRNLKRYRASVLKAAVEGRLVPTEAELARAEGRDYEPAPVLLERILAERRRRWEEAELAKMKAKGKPPKDDKWKAKYPEPEAVHISALPVLPEGWVWTSVDAVGDVLLGRQRAPQFLTGRYSRPYLRVANIKDDRIDYSDLEEMDFDAAHFEKYRLKPGDILVSEGQSPERLGQSAIYSGGIDGLCFQKTLHRFRPISFGPSSEFAQLVFRAHVKSGVFKKLGSITTNIAHLTLIKFKSAPFPLPPLGEQKRITNETERLLSIVYELKSSNIAHIVRCARLRQSLLKWAFAGRLVDQDPTDEPASRLLERIEAERESTNGDPRRSRRRPRARSSKA